MELFKSGYFYRNSPGEEPWTVTKDEIIEKEFGKYRVISFTKKLEHWVDIAVLNQKAPEISDIYRLSDGPELWLGGCNEVGGLTYPSERESLHKFIARGVDESLEIKPQLIQRLIEVSEKELEEHFNQVFV